MLPYLRSTEVSAGESEVTPLYAILSSGNTGTGISLSAPPMKPQLTELANFQPVEYTGALV